MKPSRRVFLNCVSGAGITAFAGCTSLIEEPDSRVREEETETPTESEGTATTSGEDVEGSLELLDTALRDAIIEERESVVVHATAENTADTPTEFEVTLTIGTDSVYTETLSVEANERIEFELTAEITSTGTYEIDLNDEFVGEVIVQAKKPEARRDVATHYYPWYGAPGHNWQNGQWSKESPSTPVLGNYNSSDEDVIEQHIDWCRQAGISWVNISWWLTPSGISRVYNDRIRNDILDHSRAGELDWSLLYETASRYDEVPIDMNSETNQRRFRNDLQYLADTYFDLDHYKRIADRPVLYLLLGHFFTGDIATVYENVVADIGVRPYLVVDYPIYSPLTLDAHPITEIADAATTYLTYHPWENISKVFFENIESVFVKWYLATERLDLEFIPTAIPGFDDTEITHVYRDNPPFEPSPDRYEQAVKLARRFAEGSVFVTSFNEWYENTQIEPSEEMGEKYLDITAEVLAEGERQPPSIEGDQLGFGFEQVVSESETNPGIDHPRDLTMAVSRITVHNNRDETVLDVDVGGTERDVLFVQGAYAKEDWGDITVRWFGGSQRTVLLTPTLPEHGTLIIEGGGATSMDASVSINDERKGQTSIHTDIDTYTINF